MLISPFIFLFFAFFFTICNRLYSKKVLYHLDGYALALLTNLLSAFVIFPFIIYFYPDWYILNWFEFFLIFILGILWTYVAWLGNLSIAQNNFSFKEIIRQTRIVWVVFAGVFFLGETLLLKDFIGIMFIVFSVFIISYKNFSLREHVTSLPILLAWSVAIVASVIVILEKVILNSVPVIVYAFYVYILPTLFLLFFLRKKNYIETLKLIKFSKKEVVICTFFMLCSYLTALYAYKLLPITISYPIMQTSTVVGVLVGTFIFEDKQDLGKKILATIFSILGVLIIKLI